MFFCHFLGQLDKLGQLEISKGFHDIMSTHKSRYFITLYALRLTPHYILNLLSVLKTIAADHTAAGKGFIRHRAIDDAFSVQQLQNPMYRMFFRGDDAEYFISPATFFHPVWE